MNGQYIVKITFGATGILEGSIVTNLPSYSTTKKVTCIYDNASFTVICKNVGALISTVSDYFIAVRAYYANAMTDVADYGKVIIDVLAYEPNGVTVIPSVILFSDLAGAVPNEPLYE